MNILKYITENIPELASQTDEELQLALQTYMPNHDFHNIIMGFAMGKYHWKQRDINMFLLSLYKYRNKECYRALEKLIKIWRLKHPKKRSDG
jgi:hypothetical protein